MYWSESLRSSAGHSGALTYVSLLIGVLINLCHPYEWPLVDRFLPSGGRVRLCRGPAFGGYSRPVRRAGWPTRNALVCDL